MKLRSLFLSLAVLGLAFGVGSAGHASETHKGKVNVGNNWAGGTPAEVGPSGVTVQAFLAACKVELAALKAGQKSTAIAQFLASPLNGHDGYVFDLKKEKMGAFQVKGAGAKAITPELPVIGAVPEYDLDMDFWLDPAADPAAAKTTGCLSANTASSSSHKCYSHSPKSDERAGCITGYKDSKGKVRGARFVTVNAALHVKGPMDIVLTSP